MIHFSKSGKITLSKKKSLILVGSMLLAALVGWIVLVSVLFNNAKDKEPKEMLPEVPDGYVLVFRQTAEYRISDEGRQLCREYEYDENGRKTKDKTYFEGELSYFLVYVYDAQGREIKETRYDADGSGVWVNEKVYDEEGRLKEARYDNSTTYYDDDGRELYKKTVTDTGEEIISEEWRYSDDGRLLENRKNSSGYKILYFYDSAGNLMRVERYSGEQLTDEEIYPDSPNEMELYSYEDGSRYLSQKQIKDENGNIIYQIRYMKDGSIVHERTREYDSEGRMTKELQYVDGSFYSWYEYEYKDSTAFYLGAPGPTKMTAKKEDGTISYYIEAEYVQDFGLVSERYYNEDGTRNEQWDIDYGKNYWGYYTKYDSYGNPSCVVSCNGDEENVIKEYIFTPMAIPAECMSDYDRRDKGKQYQFMQ